MIFLSQTRLPRVPFLGVVLGVVLVHRPRLHLHGILRSR